MSNANSTRVDGKQQSLPGKDDAPADGVDARGIIKSGSEKSSSSKGGSEKNDSEKSTAQNGDKASGNTANPDSVNRDSSNRGNEKNTSGVKKKVSVPDDPSVQSTTLDWQHLAEPKHYINRELSFLEFNVRVLALARDPNIPLLERLRYLCISASNLDEFFEVRVAGLQQQLVAGSLGTGPDNLSPSMQLREIRKRTHQLVEDQYTVLNEDLLPALEQCDIVFPPPDRWSVKVQRWARDFFEEELLPMLSPLGLAPSHPFPQLTNKSLNFIVSLKGCLLYTSPSPRDATLSRMPSSA